MTAVGVLSVQAAETPEQSVCRDAAASASASAHVTPDDMGCSSRARPTININGQEQVDWELSYQGGSS